MALFLQADIAALQQLSTKLRGAGEEITGVDAVEPIADAYRFLSRRISTLATGIDGAAHLLDAAERDFAAALHGIRI